MYQPIRTGFVFVSINKFLFKIYSNESNKKIALKKYSNCIHELFEHDVIRFKNFYSS